MFSKKNHIGRPTNEEIKNRKIRKILTISMPILLVIFIIILIYTKGDMSKLMGNSVVSSTHFNYELIDEKTDDCSLSGRKVECPYKLNLKPSITSSGVHLAWDNLRNQLQNKNSSVYYELTGEDSNYTVNGEFLKNRPMRSRTPVLIKTSNEYTIGGGIQAEAEYNITVTAYIPKQYDSSDYGQNDIIARTTIRFKVTPEEKIELQSNSYEGGIKLSWNKISGSAYYVITNDNNLNVKTINNFYDDKDIKAGDEVFYSVTAYDSKNEIIAKTKTIEALSTSAQKVEIIKTNRTPLGFEIEMQGGYNTSKYAVYLDDGKNYKKLGESSGNIFKWNSAKNGETYRFVAKSLDSNGKETSLFSKSYFAGEFYSAPVIRSISKIGSGVALSWNKVPGISKYAVYVKGGIYKDYKKVKETKTNAATVIMMFPAGTYTFKVVGISDSGFEATSYVEKKHVVELKKQSQSVKATLSYSCPNGYTKSGNNSNIKCTKTQTTTALKKVKEYQCAPISGIKKIGSKCQHTYAASRSYSCPSGYTKIGDGPNASCEKSEKPVTKTTTYCSGGTKWLLRNGQCEYQQQASSRCSKGSLSSGKCVYTYKASIKNRRYACPNGGTLNGSAMCVVKTNPSYSCPTFQDVRGSLKNRTCYYYKRTTTGKTQVCNRGYLYASRCILTAKTIVKYICPSTAKQSGASCIKTTNAAVVYEYYCPNGYTKSGNGSSMKCSKKSTTNATATYTCPSGYKKTGSGANTKCTK